MIIQIGGQRDRVLRAQATSRDQHALAFAKIEIYIFFYCLRFHSNKMDYIANSANISQINLRPQRIRQAVLRAGIAPGA
ncbi:MAG: hypothetical protein V1796_00100 [Pseudomonadota bacterium]